MAEGKPTRADWQDTFNSRGLDWISVVVDGYHLQRRAEAMGAGSGWPKLSHVIYVAEDAAQELAGDQARLFIPRSDDADTPDPVIVGDRLVTVNFLVTG